MSRNLHDHTKMTKGECKFTCADPAMVDLIKDCVQKKDKGHTETCSMNMVNIVCVGEEKEKANLEAINCMKSSISDIILHVENIIHSYLKAEEKGRIEIIKDEKQLINREAGAAFMRACLMKRVPCWSINDIIEGNDFKNQSTTNTTVLVNMLKRLPLRCKMRMTRGCECTLIEKNNTPAIIALTTKSLIFEPGYEIHVAITPPLGEELEENDSVNEKTILGYLRPGEAVNMKFTLKVGFGAEDSRFQCTVLPNIIEIDEKICVSFGLMGQHTYQKCANEVSKYIRSFKYLRPTPMAPYAIAPLRVVWFENDGADGADGADENDKVVKAEECLMPELGQRLLQVKQQWGKMNKGKLNYLRNAANPWNSLDNIKASRQGKQESEGIYFLDRAVIKIIELDFLFDLINNAEKLANKNTVFIADIAAGPGSFSEYVLWRTRTDNIDAKVFGFTLNTPEARFQTDSFNSISLEQVGLKKFEDFSGESGDVKKQESVEEFANKLIESANTTDVDGTVHLAMMDGGDNNHVTNQDEAQTAELVKGQLDAAMKVLVDSGTLVCKMFMTETPLMVSMLATVMKKFESVTFVKPVGSRETNSEKYLVAVGFKRKAHSETNNSEHESVYLSPPSFTAYMKDINTFAAEQQLEAMQKVVNNQVVIYSEEQKNEISNACRRLWRVPVPTLPAEDEKPRTKRKRK